MSNRIPVDIEVKASAEQAKKALNDTAKGLLKVNTQVENLAKSFQTATAAILEQATAVKKQVVANKELEASNKGNIVTNNQLIKQQRVIASLFGTNSVVAQKKYLSGVHGLQAGLRQFNEEAKTTIVLNKQHVSTLADVENSYARFMLKGNMVTRTMDNMAKKAINLGKNLQWTGRQMMVGLTLPIVAGGALAIKTFLSMEKARLRARKLTGALGDKNDPSVIQGKKNFKILEDAAKHFSVAWGESFESVIKVASEFAGTGFTAQAAKDLTEMSLAFDKLSGIGNLDTTMKFIRVMTQTSGMKKQGDAVKYTRDQLAYLSKVDQGLSIDMNEIIQSWPEVANVFKQSNVSIAEGIGMLSAAKQGGIDVASAATAIGRSMARIMGGASTGEGRGLKLLKKNIDEWNAAHPDKVISFFDKLGNIDKGNAGIKRVSLAFRSMTQEQQANFARLAFGTEQYKRMVPILNAVADAQDKFGSKDNDYRKAINTYQDFIAHKGKFSSDFSEAISAYKEDPATKFAGLKVQLQLLGDEMGKELIPTVSKFITKIGKLLAWFEHLSPKTKNMIKNFLILAAVVGPITYGLGQMILLFTQLAKFTFLTPLKTFFHLFDMPHRMKTFSKDMAGELIALQNEFAKTGDMGAFLNGINKLRDEQRALRVATDEATGSVAHQNGVFKAMSARIFGSSKPVAGVNPVVEGMKATAANAEKNARNTAGQLAVAAEREASFVPETYRRQTVSPTRIRKRIAGELGKPSGIVGAGKAVDAAEREKFLWATYAPMLVEHNALTTKELNNDVVMKKLLLRMDKELGPAATPQQIQAFMVKHLAKTNAAMTAGTLSEEQVAKLVAGNKGRKGLPILPGVLKEQFGEEHVARGTLNYSSEEKKRAKEEAREMRAQLEEFKRTGKMPVSETSAAGRYIKMTRAKELRLKELQKKINELEMAYNRGELTYAQWDAQRNPLMARHGRLMRSVKGGDSLQAALRKSQRGRLVDNFSRRLDKVVPTTQEIAEHMKTVKKPVVSSVLNGILTGKIGDEPESLLTKEQLFNLVGRQVHGGLTGKETVNILKEQFGPGKDKEAEEVAKIIEDASRAYYAQLLPGHKLTDLQPVKKTEVLSADPMKLQKGGKKAHGDSEAEKYFTQQQEDIDRRQKQLDIVQGKSKKLEQKAEEAKKKAEKIEADHQAKIDALASKEVGEKRAIEDKKVADLKAKNNKILADLAKERSRLEGEQARFRAEEAKLQAEIASIETEQQRVNAVVNESLKGRTAKDRLKFLATGGFMGSVHGDVSEEEMAARTRLASRGEEISRTSLRREMGKTSVFSRTKTSMAKLKPTNVKSRITTGIKNVGSAGKSGAGLAVNALAAVAPGAVLKEGAEGAEKFVSKLGKMEGVLGKVKGGFGKMLPMIDMFTGGMGSAAAAGVEPVVTGLAALGPLLIPIGLVAGAIFLIWKNWSQVSKGLGGGLKALKSAFGALKDAIIGPFVNVFKRLNSGGSQMKDTWKSVGKLLNVIFHALAIAMRLVAAVIKPLMTTFAEMFYILVQIGRFVVSVLTGQWSAAFGAIESIVASASKVILTALLFPLNMFLKVVKKLANVSIFGHHLVPKSVRDDISGISDFVDKLPSKLAKAIDPNKAYKAGKKAGNAARDGARDGMTPGPKGPVIKPDNGEAAQAGKDQAKAFVDAYKGEIGKIVDGWKQAALDAFDAAAKIQTDAIDAQIKKIDDYEKKLEEAQREEEYIQRRKDLLAKRNQSNLQYTIDHSNAIKSGQYDEARKITLDHQQDIDSINRDILDADKQHQEEKEKEARDAERTRLENQKTSLQEQLEAQKHNLQLMLDAITEYLPKNETEAKKMQQAILDAMGQYGVHYYNMGAEQAANWGKGLSYAMDKARKDIADDKAWEAMGDYIAGQIALGMGIDKSELKTTQSSVDQSAIGAILSGGGGIFSYSSPGAVNAGGGGIFSYSPEDAPKHHSGGPIGNTSMSPEDVSATLQTGEFVIKRSSVSKYGLGALNALNDGKANVYHTGGIVASAKNAIGTGLWGLTNRFIAGKSNIGNLTLERLKTIYALRFFEKHPEVVAALSGNKTASSSPLTTAGLLIKPLADFITKMFPGSSIMSMLRPGAITAHTGRPSLHGVGRAVDIGGSRAIMKNVFDYMLKNTGRFNLQELIFEHQIWNQGRGLHAWNWDDHMNHVHVGIRDALNAANLTQLARGGNILRDGIAKVHKGETVLTKPLSDDLKAKVGGGGDTYIVVDTFIGQEAWFKKMMADYNIKVVTRKDRELGRETRTISSYADTQKGYR